MDGDDLRQGRSGIALAMRHGHQLSNNLRAQKGDEHNRLRTNGVWYPFKCNMSYIVTKLGRTPFLYSRSASERFWAPHTFLRVIAVINLHSLLTCCNSAYFFR